MNENLRQKINQSHITVMEEIMYKMDLPPA